MFAKVMVPVDLTDRHQPALALAAKLLAPGGEVVVLHVIEVIHGLSREEEPTFYQRLERKAVAHLDRLVSHLKGLGASARSSVVFGERVPEVLAQAEREKVGLIVLSSHPVEATAPGASWASMSYLIGIAARCPVLLVK
jgi:nucleotide-binding universal stress UspA family protein